MENHISSAAKKGIKKASIAGGLIESPNEQYHYQYNTS